jgi:PAS domain S-box-containing protein
VPEIFSTRIRHRDGHTIEIEANGTSISWEGKKALLGIIRDVTERKQAENALKESQDLYQTLAESSPDMIYLIDREGYIRYVNSKAAQQFRQKPTEIMGKRLVDVFPADIARHHMEGITRTFTTGKPGFSEIFESFPTRDIWINARLNPVKDSKGVLTHVLGISTDITDHKRAEQVLRDDEAKLRTIFESVQAGIVIIDPVSHKIVDINSVASRLIGGPKERIIGQVCHQFICPAAEGNCPICDLNQVVDNSERILLTMNQKEVPILKTVVPIMLNGRQHLLESFIDISELKRAEEELLALNRDLEGKVLERTESLNNSLKDKELLLREIHHRVKNNLQIIISLLNLQSRYITDEKTLAAIRESQNRVKAMALVHEKLYQSADIARINLDDYVQFLGNSLFQFYGMRGKGIVFTTTIPEISLDINTAIPIGLIINELVSNSLKYAFPNGKRGEISIGIKREDHRVTILFKDTGTGIPADFDWRNAKSLGLRLVVSLVEQLFGTIELDRAAGTAYTIVVNEKE